MKKIIAAFTLTAMVLTGCGAEEANQEETTFQEIVVQIQTAEQLPVGEEVVLSVKVSQGEKAVDDADVVEFEVWESGLRDEGQMIEGTFTKDGVYEANYTFDHDGVYYMLAHTTARGLHTMPKQKLTVGSPDLSIVLPDENDDTMHNSH
ncbi:FixH family protein [Psychrobacillus sp. OK032]|uniref:FixH family protein n=1 Tax=Psychrobacillus sp. OK032 TaxID=1884358 RepID=UPI0008AE46A1|nr:FixH family protein [Psychrobacillus sp. OK032]SES19505.1 YtkA-like [Psychrobacillus sp. OK032]